MEQSLVMLALLQLLNEESDKSLDKETLLSQLGITEELLKICIEQLALLNCKIKVEGELRYYQVWTLQIPICSITQVS